MQSNAREEPAEESDAELISRFRDGDAEAYGLLWERHVSAAVAAARATTDRVDPEDVAAESFLSVMETLRRGRGPEFAFRPYLITSVRNMAARMGRRQARDVPLGEAELEDPRFSEEALAQALDNSLLSRGFLTLPVRWQEVLWYTEVEELSPAEVAGLMGLKPAAVSSLAYRAREGLRRAWIKEHVASAPAGSECRWTLDHLPARERDALKKGEEARLERHLAECAYCPIAAEDAEDASRRLGPAALTAIFGASAGAYLAFAHPAPATAATAATAATTAAAPSMLAGASAVVHGTWVAVTIGAATAATAGALLSTILTGPGPAKDDGVIGLGAPPAASASHAPVLPPVVAARGTPTPSPRASEPPVTDSPAAAPQPEQTATASAPAPTTPGTPVVTGVDTGGGRLYPVLSGTGQPGATVTIRTGTLSWSTLVGADAAWSSAPLSGITAGVTELEVEQSAGGAPSAQATVTVNLASIGASRYGGPDAGQQQLTVTGVVDSTITLAFAGTTSTVSTNHQGTTSAEVPAGTSQLTAYYVDGGRRGPAITIVLPQN